MTKMLPEPFLTLHDYHLSREKGREAVLTTLGRGASGRPRNVDWIHGTVKVSYGAVTKLYTFADLEQEARKTGVVAEIQRLLDRDDDVFGGTSGDIATPNTEIKLTTEYAGWRREVVGPCRIGLATDDLMADIMYYRSEVCLTSNDYTFVSLGRHYREYLAACISIVDAFINRHILLASHDNFQSDAFTRLKAARGMEEKVDCWLQTCCDHKTFKTLAARKEWCHFQQLRQERNALQHAVEPFSVYSVKEMARYLNYTRTGIGELLRLLRDWHGKPSLLFIERLRTAPLVEFHPVKIKAQTPAQG